MHLSEGGREVQAGKDRSRNAQGSQHSAACRGHHRAQGHRLLSATFMVGLVLSFLVATPII
jgi:hypothetical protein